MKDMDEIRIIDFGSSRDMQSEAIRSQMSEKELKFQHYVGTSEYLAPECINNKDSSPASDIWSLGCVLYQLYAGITPYKRDTEYLTYKAALEEQIVYPPQVVMPLDIKDLISSMMQAKPEDRPQISEVLKSQAFEGISRA